MRPHFAISIVFYLAIIPALALPSRAQDNYEIQVYAYDTVAPRHTMVELHSNFTFQGSKNSQNGLLPTNHQLHETIEITHGFTDWFETGFYIFTSAQNGQGWDWVGDHIRPRVRIPKKWNKQAGRWYWSLNPTFDKSLHGQSVRQGFVFSPNFKFGCDFTKKVAGGIEYYGAVGPATDFLPTGQQQHQIFPTLDLNLSPNWEVNFGLGVGVTHSTDHLIAKMILGYRFNF